MAGDWGAVLDGGEVAALGVGMGRKQSRGYVVVVAIGCVGNGVGQACVGVDAGNKLLCLAGWGQRTARTTARRSHGRCVKLEIQDGKSEGLSTDACHQQSCIARVDGC